MRDSNGNAARPASARVPRAPESRAWEASDADESSRRPRGERWLRRLAIAQGVFYIVTGIWPVLHIRSFMVVTGPKTDLWLVQTVGLLLAVTGAVLAAAARRRRLPGELCFLGAATALTLAAVDLVFTARQVIAPIYLADAAGELLIALLWALFWKQRSRIDNS